MKRMDFIIITVLIIISGISFGIYKGFYNKNYEKKYAEVYVKGELYKSIPLKDKNYKDTFTIKTDLGKNIVDVENGMIAIKKSDCHNQVCVKEGYISRVGETIACLPHKVLIEIKGEDKSEIDEVSY